MTAEISRVDAVVPPKTSIFEPVEGPRGLRLALVFGNEAPNGRCPFYESQCMHCDLGAGEGLRFTTALNAQRLEFFKRHYGEIFNRVNHLVIYNSGSTLNPHEMALETLKGILAWVESLPECRRASFDSREVFVTPERVKFLIDRAGPDQAVGLTLGVESQNDAIRQENLGKRMTRQHIERVFQILSQFPNRTAVEMNIVFQPPGIQGNEAVEEALATIKFGLDLSERFGVTVDFNYHPYYPSVKGTVEFPEHPRAILQDGIKALILISRCIKERGGRSRIFVGWNDEGHDNQPWLKHRELMLYAPGILNFNRTQSEEDLRI